MSTTMPVANFRYQLRETKKLEISTLSNYPDIVVKMTQKTDNKLNYFSKSIQNNSDIEMK